MNKHKKYSNINIKTLFFPLFTAFSVFILFWFDNYNHELLNFNGRVLGISTLEKIDVKLRISQFYKAFFFSLFSFIILLFLNNKLFIINRKIRVELLLVNYISLIGIFVLTFYILGHDVKASVFFLASLLITLIITGIIKLIFKNSFIYSENFFFLWSSMISLSITILLIYILNWSSFEKFIIVFTVLNVLVSLFFSLKILKFDYKFLYRIFKYWVIIPFAIFFSQELYMIFNQRGIQIVKPELILLLIIVLILGITIYLFLKNKKVDLFKNIKQTKRFYFSVLIISLLFYTYYTGYGKEPNEMFEVANISNSIMNFFHFGKFPVLEFLPTHLVQDISYGYLYTFLNGYQPDFSYTSYHFLFAVFTSIIFYFFLAKVSNNYIAFIIILFFPFVGTITWSIKGAIFLLVPLLTFKLFQNANLKNFILFFLVLLLEVSWSPDSGSASLIIMLISLILIIKIRYKKGILKDTLIALIIVFLPVIITIITIGLIKDINIIENIKTALEFYSSSPQARGYSEFAKDYNILFIFHHIIAPFFIMSVLVLIIFKAKTFYKRNSFVFIAFITIALFYLLNIQRGLIRHSFYEGNDAILSSFLFLLAALLVYMFNIKSKIIKTSLFIGFLMFSVLFLKLKPLKDNQNLIAALINRIENPVKIKKSDTIIRRIKKSSLYTKNKDLISFLNKNLKESETYFDFSNTPLLYYITQHKIPVYFIHFLAVTNDNLQEKMIEELKANDVPIVIFSSYPKIWWDKTDGLENTVRYYKVAEYIYMNYKPFSIINKHTIWKKNNFVIKDSMYYENNISGSVDIFELKKLAYLWAKYDNETKKASIIQELKKSDNGKNIFNFEFFENFDKTYGNYLELKINNSNKKPDECIVEIYSDSIFCGGYKFDILTENEREKYIIRPSVQYNWYKEPVNNLKISFKNSNSIVEEVKILKGN